MWVLIMLGTNRKSFKSAMLKTKKTILVFEGGGAKGLVYAGAIKIAEKNGLFKDIDKVGGSSAGGIVSFLVGTGHNAAEIEKIMMELDLQETLQDSSPIISKVNSTVNLVNETAKIAVPIYGLARYAMDAELPMETGDAGATVYSLLNACYGSGEYTGAWKGEKFIAKAREILKAKLGVDRLTFAQLHQLKIERPELGLKDLYLTGTDAETGESVIFSHENEETKNVDIIDALRATASFPFAFAAHEIVINGKKRKFIDGGVKNNYPMNIFDLENDKGERIPNPAVLGFKVDGKKECEEILFKEGIQNGTRQIGKFTAHTHKGDVRQFYRYNTVQIYDAGVWTLNFDLDELTKLILKLSGEESMKAFIKEGYHKTPVHNNELITTLMKMGNDLNDGNYSAVQKGLMTLQTKYPEHAEQVAQIIVRTMEKFKIAGLKPGATEAYNVLIKEAELIGKIKADKSQAGPIIRDTTIASAAVGGALWGAGMLNPVTLPVVAVAGGAVLLHRYWNSRKNSLATPMVFTMENVKNKINGYEFNQALELIRANSSTLSLADIIEFKKALNSLTTKGVFNQTRAEYDALNSYLEVQENHLRAKVNAAVDVDELVDSFEHLRLSPERKSAPTA